MARRGNRGNRGLGAIKRKFLTMWSQVYKERGMHHFATMCSLREMLKFWSVSHEIALRVVKDMSTTLRLESFSSNGWSLNDHALLIDDEIQEFIWESKLIDPMMENGRHQTILETAIIIDGETDSPIVMSVLKQFPELAKVTNTNGDTPLTVAIQYGRLEVVKKLIELGTPINTTDIHGTTMLEKVFRMYAFGECVWDEDRKTPPSITPITMLIFEILLNLDVVIPDTIVDVLDDAPKILQIVFNGHLQPGSNRDLSDLFLCIM